MQFKISAEVLSKAEAACCHNSENCRTPFSVDIHNRFDGFADEQAEDAEKQWTAEMCS